MKKRNGFIFEGRRFLAVDLVAKVFGECEERQMAQVFERRVLRRTWRLRMYLGLDGDLLLASGLNAMWDLIGVAGQGLLVQLGCYGIQEDMVGAVSKPLVWPALQFQSLN